MKNLFKKTSLLCVVAGSVLWTHAETHFDLQSVNEMGGSAWDGELPFTIRGIITTTLEEMLDTTPNFLPWNAGANSGQMGAEWQIVFQASETGDRGGTLLWLGQCYGNQPWIRDENFSYSDEAWTEELERVSTDAESGHVFQPGDLVEVTARKALFYGGKRNINEAHSNDPANNFDIRLIEAGVGLPEAEVITLKDLVLPDEDGLQAQKDIFDVTRQSGGEYYQGVRVRLNNLQIVQAEGWTPEGTWAQRKNIRVTDGENRFFTVRYPRRDLGSVPTGTFDAIGIISQESGSGTEGTTGYEFFIQEVIGVESPVLSMNAQGYIQWEQGLGSEWVLESASSLNGPWNVVSQAPEMVDSYFQVKVDFSESKCFFRLRKTS